MRKAFNGMKSDEAVENILNMFVRTKNNHEFVELVKNGNFSKKLLAIEKSACYNMKAVYRERAVQKD